MKYFSPAKINLFLKVLGKRPDGYHNLSSLMQTIDLGDSLHFDWKGESGLTCTDPSIPTDASNLVNKAIDLFGRKTGWRNPVKVHLEKRIPAQAGLGGGSSNAATTLWALNEQAGRPAKVEELLAWSAEIGSDIPFFFSEGTALCEGRGELVMPLQGKKCDPFWIVKPAIGLSTASVFQNYKPSRSSSNDKFFNDLEAPAFALKPELLSLKMILLSTSFEKVLMTGSGTAFICMGKKGPLPLLPNVSVYPVRFLNRLPLQWY